jgi:hypothetical protein
MNKKGEFIFSVVLILLIVAIIYFAFEQYYNPEEDNLEKYFDKDTVDSSTEVENGQLEEYEELYNGSTDNEEYNPVDNYNDYKENDTSNEDVDDSDEEKVKVTAELENIEKITIDDYNIELEGEINIIVRNELNKKHRLTNPSFVDFKGEYNIKEGHLIGLVNLIKIYENTLEIKNYIKTEGEIKKIFCDEMNLSLENTFVSGSIEIADVSKTLDKAYVKIKGYKGPITFEGEKLIIDGEASYVKIINDNTTFIVD